MDIKSHEVSGVSVSNRGANEKLSDGWHEYSSPSHGTNLSLARSTHKVDARPPPPHPRTPPHHTTPALYDEKATGGLNLLMDKRRCTTC